MTTIPPLIIVETINRLYEMRFEEEYCYDSKLLMKLKEDIDFWFKKLGEQYYVKLMEEIELMKDKND